MKANKKPWGHEILAFQNEDVAVWHLFIDPWEETSLHCHPDKKTGLVVLSGGAKVSFLNGGYNLFAGDKIMIRQGVFHKTKNMTNQQLQLFEIETPVDKGNLVRMEDKYNRPIYYEKEPTTTVDITYPWKKHSKTIGDCSVRLVKDFSSPLCGSYMILEGGLFKDYFVSAPGDVISGENFTYMIDRFQLLPNTKAIQVVNENL